MADEGVRAAARAVRWFLPELAGADAGKIDTEIADLLAEASGRDNVQGRLRELLERWETTSVFLEAVLDDSPEFRPPQARPGALKEANYSGLPGLIGPVGVSAPEYRCPLDDDYDWWQVAEP